MPSVFFHFYLKIFTGIFAPVSAIVLNGMAGTVFVMSHKWNEIELERGSSGFQRSFEKINFYKDYFYLLGISFATAFGMMRGNVDVEKVLMAGDKKVDKLVKQGKDFVQKK